MTPEDNLRKAAEAWVELNLTRTQADPDTIRKMSPRYAAAHADRLDLGPTRAAECERVWSEAVESALGRLVHLVTFSGAPR